TRAVESEHLAAVKPGLRAARAVPRGAHHCDVGGRGADADLDLERVVACGPPGVDRIDRLLRGVGVDDPSEPDAIGATLTPQSADGDVERPADRVVQSQIDSALRDRRADADSTADRAVEAPVNAIDVP